MANVYTDVPWAEQSPQYKFVSFVDEVITRLEKERLSFWLSDLEDDKIAKMLKGMSMRTKEIVSGGLKADRAAKVLNMLDSMEPITAKEALDSIIESFDKLIEELMDSHAYWTRVGEETKI